MQSLKKGDFSFKYPSEETLYNEINLIPNNSDIVIKENKLNIISKPNKFFNRSILDPKVISDLISWKEDWSKLFSSITAEHKLNCCVSGGFDSRLLWYIFCKDLDNVNVTNWEAKPNVNDSVDKELCTKVLTYYNKLNTCTFRPKRDVVIEEWNKEPNDSHIFTDGIIFNPKNFLK